MTTIVCTLIHQGKVNGVKNSREKKKDKLSK